MIALRPTPESQRDASGDAGRTDRSWMYPVVARRRDLSLVARSLCAVLVSARTEYFTVAASSAHGQRVADLGALLGGKLYTERAPARAVMSALTELSEQELIGYQLIEAPTSARPGVYRVWLTLDVCDVERLPVRVANGLTDFLQGGGAGVSLHVGGAATRAVRRRRRQRDLPWPQPRAPRSTLRCRPVGCDGIGSRDRLRLALAPVAWGLHPGPRCSRRNRPLHRSDPIQHPTRGSGQRAGALMRKTRIRPSSRSPAALPASVGRNRRGPPNFAAQRLPFRRPDVLYGYLSSFAGSPVNTGDPRALQGPQMYEVGIRTCPPGLSITPRPAVGRTCPSRAGRKERWEVQRRHANATAVEKSSACTLDAEIASQRYSRFSGFRWRWRVGSQCDRGC